jgi:hypothetical protein
VSRKNHVNINDAKGCALQHITKARALLADAEYRDADTLLEYAEEHLKEL